MKRSELKVGEAYYHDRSTNWMSYPSGNKAVLVDDKRYAIQRRDWGWNRRQPQYREDPKGNAVLVEFQYGRDGEVISTSPEAVPVTHLRGPWEQTKAAVDAAVKERRDAEDARREARTVARRRATAAQERATALGLKSACESPYRISVPVEEFEQLLDAFDRSMS